MTRIIIISVSINKGTFFFVRLKKDKIRMISCKALLANKS